MTLESAKYKITRGCSFWKYHVYRKTSFLFFPYWERVYRDDCMEGCEAFVARDRQYDLPRYL